MQESEFFMHKEEIETYRLFHPVVATEVFRREIILSPAIGSRKNMTPVTGDISQVIHTVLFVILGSKRSSGVNIDIACKHLSEKARVGPILGWKSTAAWPLTNLIIAKLNSMGLMPPDALIVPEYIDGDLFIVAREKTKELVHPWP